MIDNFVIFEIKPTISWFNRQGIIFNVKTWENYRKMRKKSSPNLDQLLLN